MDLGHDLNGEEQIQNQPPGKSVSHPISKNHHFALFGIIFVFIVALLGLFTRIEKAPEKKIIYPGPTLTPTEIQPQISICDSFICNYPSTWNGEQQIPSPYLRSFVIYSPNYISAKELAFTGSTILITELPTKYASTEQEFNSTKLNPPATDIQWLIVDGVKAVQYNASFEGPSYETYFIKNGIKYSFYFNYYNLDDKEAGMPIYRNLINSFQEKK